MRKRRGRGACLLGDFDSKINAKVNINVIMTRSIQQGHPLQSPCLSPFSLKACDNRASGIREASTNLDSCT